MRFWSALACAVLLWGCAALAEENAGQAVVLPEQEFAFVLPADWEPHAIPEDAAGEGVVYAAKSGDGGIQLFVRLSPLEENEGMAAFSIQEENAPLGKTIAADGVEFLFRSEVFRDREVTLTYRTATAIHGQSRICFIWVDYAGNGAEMAEQVMKSFQRLTKEREDYQ